MKSIIFILLVFSSVSAVHAQDDSQKLPPFHMLPKDGEVKNIYELPYECIYQLFNSKGDLIQDSIAEFIDMTPLEKGTYFIKFEGKSIKYDKTSEKPAPKKPEAPKKLIYDFPEK
ncbi:MAG: hypothetical protein AB8B53_12120 [Flavobacteriales bacterium]